MNHRIRYRKPKKKKNPWFAGFFWAIILTILLFVGHGMWDYHRIKPRSSQEISDQEFLLSLPSTPSPSEGE